MKLPIQTEPKQNGIRFEDDVRTAVQSVRSSLAEILTSVGADVSQPRHMAKRFGLDKTLAWKLSRVVSEDKLAALVDHLPGRAGLDIAIRSLESAGASSYSIAALRHALADFERAVEVHCGDRETLELMLGYMHDEGQQQREEAHRKRAFNGNRAIWGVQARLQVCAHYVRPNDADPTMLDISTVSGLVDLRRLREDTVWPVASFRKYSDDGSLVPTRAHEPVDVRVNSHGELPILRDFSSDPLPSVRETKGNSGRTTYELTEGPVGNTAAVTCLTGIIARAPFSMYRDEHNTFGEHLVGLNTPVETLVHDLYLHRSLAQLANPQVALYSQLPSEPVYPTGGRARGPIRFCESMIDLGEAPAEVVTPELPRYRALNELVFERLGGNVREFRGYRFRMRYPPMPAVALFRWELPKRA